MDDKKKYIWYQVEGHDINYINQPSTGELYQLRKKIKQEEELQVAPKSLILEAKKEDEIEYTTLDADFFRDKCNNDFDSLINIFKNKRQNPIKVTLPGMFLSLYFVRFSLQKYGLASLRSYHGGN